MGSFGMQRLTEIGLQISPASWNWWWCGVFFTGFMWYQWDSLARQ